MADDRDDGGSDGEREESVPLGDLADRVRARRSGEEVRIGEPGPDDVAADAVDEFFEAEAFEDIDADDLWASIEEAPADTGGVDVGEGPDEHIVSKRAYCEGCEYFSEPPDVHCNHSGTTIVEFADLDHVRVRNCPIVKQRQALGEREEGGMTQMSFGSQGQD